MNSTSEIFEKRAGPTYCLICLLAGPDCNSTISHGQTCRQPPWPLISVGIRWWPLLTCHCTWISCGCPVQRLVIRLPRVHTHCRRPAASLAASVVGEWVLYVTLSIGSVEAHDAVSINRGLLHVHLICIPQGRQALLSSPCAVRHGIWRRTRGNKRAHTHMIPAPSSRTDLRGSSAKVRRSHRDASHEGRP